MMPCPEETPDQRVQRFVALCRRHGVRLTSQRLALFQELACTRTHPTTDELYTRLRCRLPNLSIDTVYRMLGKLHEWGAVRRLEVLDDQSRYEVNLAPHHHFVCVCCRRTEDVHWPELDALPWPDGVGSLGAVEWLHAEFRGRCAVCADASGPRPE